MRSLRKLLKNRKGQAIFEYGLILAGVALVAVAALAVYGAKTADMIAAAAAVMPGASSEDNGPIITGRLVELTSAADGPIRIDVGEIVLNTGVPRLGNNIGLLNAENFWRVGAGAVVSYRFDTGSITLGMRDPKCSKPTTF